MVRSNQLKTVENSLLDQRFQLIGRNPIQVHMVTSVGVWCVIWTIYAISDSSDKRMKEGGGGEKPSNPYVIPVGGVLV